ncbi:hypothetical protein ACH5RR_028695 [Cinchona calisaya]|uniref:Uncharacterized protein n=1 Tax=Cinchona calisaya TaxID=153742 RepID=A0ABD2YPJ2_9GENT
MSDWLIACGLECVRGLGLWLWEVGMDDGLDGCLYGRVRDAAGTWSWPSKYGQSTPSCLAKGKCSRPGHYKSGVYASKRLSAR